MIQGRAVTEDEKNQYKQLRQQGVSIKKIAEQFGRQPAVVYNHLKKMGLTKTREGGGQDVVAAAAAEGIKMVGMNPTPAPTATGAPVPVPTTITSAQPKQPPIQVGKPKNLLDLLGGSK